MATIIGDVTGLQQRYHPYHGGGVNLRVRTRP